MSAIEATAVRPVLHAATWIVWAAAAVVSVQLAPNVLYASLVLLLAVLVVEVHGRKTGLARAFPVFLALGASFGLLRVFLTVATTHGLGNPMFTVPHVTLPRLLGGFRVGGTIERQVLLQALADALVIVVVIAVFGAWNAVVSHHEVLQSTPRAFHELGLVVTIALAFVPSTLAALRASREADRARTGGAIVRRGRLVRHAVPVLESGMERAVALAESMDARGFGHRPAGRGERIAAAGTLGGLLGLGGAFVALIGGAHTAAAISGGLGVALLIGAIASASGAARRVRYRPRHLTALDGRVMAAVLVAPLGLVILGAAGDHSLTWAPNGSGLPPFHPLVVLALLALSVPAIVGSSGSGDANGST
ncbi:MAG: energy-coupling factor transport system permease protein [Actinomycetota bacterium]|nr:energy-coupling factor transport system permease protein [Actinomycetota bacterium]